MIINNYVITNPVALRRLDASHAAHKFVEFITDLINQDLKEVYSLVTDSDSLTLDQFVTLSMSSQCNQMLNDLIRKVGTWLTQLRGMKVQKQYVDVVDHIGFAKGLPYNYEDMVRKLVFRIREKEIRDEFDLQKNKSAPEDFVKLKMECLQKIYGLAKDNSEYCVQKYESVYQLNKRNISGANQLDPEMAQKSLESRQEFYTEYFKQQRMDRENSDPVKDYASQETRSQTKKSVYAIRDELKRLTEPELEDLTHTEGFKTLKPLLDVVSS